jgi:hypothetical protein
LAGGTTATGRQRQLVAPTSGDSADQWRRASVSEAGLTLHTKVANVSFEQQLTFDHES